MVDAVFVELESGRAIQVVFIRGALGGLAIRPDVEHEPEPRPLNGRAYSVDGTRYPATLVTTAESDTRVAPLHARKFAARLQAANRSGLPILLRIETKAGHGAGKPVTKQIEEAADVWTFLFWQLGVKV